MFNPPQPPGSEGGGERGEETDPQPSSTSPGARQSAAMEDAVVTPERGDRHPHFSRNPTQHAIKLFSRRIQQLS